MTQLLPKLFATALLVCCPSPQFSFQVLSSVCPIFYITVNLANTISSAAGSVQYFHISLIKKRTPTCFPLSITFILHASYVYKCCLSISYPKTNQNQLFDILTSMQNSELKGSLRFTKKKKKNHFEKFGAYACLS